MPASLPGCAGAAASSSSSSASRAPPPSAARAACGGCGRARACASGAAASAPRAGRAAASSAYGRVSARAAARARGAHPELLLAPRLHQRQELRQLRVLLLRSRARAAGARSSGANGGGGRRLLRSARGEGRCGRGSSRRLRRRVPRAASGVLAPRPRALGRLAHGLGQLRGRERRAAGEHRAHLHLQPRRVHERATEEAHGRLRLLGRLEADEGDLARAAVAAAPSARGAAVG